MFRIETSDNIQYSKTLRYIKLAPNGCYVECSEEDAGGVCAKIMSQNENGDVTYDDTVFSIKDNGLSGVKKASSFKKMQEATPDDVYKGRVAQDMIEILVGENTAITYKEAKKLKKLIDKACKLFDIEDLTDEEI